MNTQIISQSNASTRPKFPPYYRHLTLDIDSTWLAVGAGKSGFAFAKARLAQGKAALAFPLHANPSDYRWDVCEGQLVYIVDEFCSENPETVLALAMAIRDAGARACVIDTRYCPRCEIPARCGCADRQGTLIARMWDDE